MIYEDPRTTKAREEYLGKEFEFNSGNKDVKMKVVKFENYSNTTVQVGDTDFYINASMSNIKIGNVYNPFKENCPIGFMNNKDRYENRLFRTNQGYLIKVIEYEKDTKVLYEFIDNGYRDITTIHNIKVGQVRNPFHRNKFGGYLGPDKTYRHKRFEWLRKIWNNMVIRAGENNTEYYLKYHTSHIYDDVTLDDRWYCYSLFAEWYMYHYSQLNPNFSYSIDKDLKFSIYSKFTGGKKRYSPETCLLIPQELNVMIEAKAVRDSIDNGVSLDNDHNIKKVAKYYKDNNGLSDEAYNIIMGL